jgi:cytoskeletal protein CcmA (bactofilin family)
MTDQVQHNQFILQSRVTLDSLYTPDALASGDTDNQTSATGDSESSSNRLTRFLSSLISRLSGSVFGITGFGIGQLAGIGGARVIFRRENRGESFQRQIDNLRQQPGESPANDEDLEFEYEYEADETGDTSQFSTDEGTPAEGISFPAARAEAEEPEAEAAPAVPAAPPAPATPSYAETSRWQPAADSTASIIASNTHWNGTMRSEGSIRVHGQADGELYSATDLFVAEGAEVDASLYAESVVVAGLVRGKIEARTRLEVLPQGEVTGDVRAPKLVVHEGASISGQLKMDVSDSRSTYSRETKPSSSKNEP